MADSENTTPLPGAGRSFLSSPKHLDRVKALRRAMEGVSQPVLLHQLQAGRCFYCDKPLSSASHAPDRPDGWTIDHVIPQTFGGARFFGNKVLSCAACNGAKGNRVSADWILPGTGG